MKTIELISVPVTDQQKSKAFYLKMGLELVRESPFANNQTWIQLRFPGGGPEIALVNWFDKMPPGSLQGLVLTTEDIDKDIQRLNESGIKTGNLDQTPWGKFVAITDPDGNNWNLHQY